MEYTESATPEELAEINGMLKDVNLAMAMSMSYIRKFQGWQFDQLEKRCQGISSATWKRYLQPSYTKIRPLHAVAAYSWLTMLPMPCFYRGLNIKEAYPNMDDISVNCLIHSGLLPKQQFDTIIAYLSAFLNEEQQAQVANAEAELLIPYGNLSDYQDHQFMFPATLDIEAFSNDYYYSLAISLQQFREKNQISIDTMAEVLNLSVRRYKQCEHPDNAIPLPVELGARLQVGFRLKNVLALTSHMQVFPQYHTARRVQELRQTLFAETMTFINPSYKSKILEMVVNIASIVKDIEHGQEMLKKATTNIVENTAVNKKTQIYTPV